MVLDNDVRGWIMTCISGIACVCGASIICVDLVAQMIPRYRNFEIASSNTFLSASLSLSFGVMLFSALYSMLPSAKQYLVSGTFSPQAASYTLIGLFLGGAIGIQILSRAMHHFIPTHIVDCDHHHRNEGSVEEQGDVEQQRLPDARGTLDDKSRPPLSVVVADEDEETPLLARDHTGANGRHLFVPEDTGTGTSTKNGFVTAPNASRPHMLPRKLTQTFAKIASPKPSCDETGPCKGISDPCGQKCFESASRQRSEIVSSGLSRSSTFHHNSTTPAMSRSTSRIPQVTEAGRPDAAPRRFSEIEYSGRSTHHSFSSADQQLEHADSQHQDHAKQNGQQHECDQSTASDARAEHHHHVPTNAFLSIGLQTSLAIALHKAPEGFITYATNHANPSLGFAVFMALFIHNISEGFAMALPLYLALQSRTKAVLWSSLLGGFSQPLGAGVAAIWFRVAKGGTGVGRPSEDVYGCMFAITAGVMASVALQLFSESIALTHNKNICIGFAFLGMAILGVSSALTA